MLRRPLEIEPRYGHFWRAISADWEAALCHYATLTQLELRLDLAVGAGLLARNSS